MNLVTLKRSKIQGDVIDKIILVYNDNIPIAGKILSEQKLKVKLSNGTSDIYEYMPNFRNC